MVLETLEALASWRLKSLVNTKPEYTGRIEKNKVIGTYTSCTLEDLDFIFNKLSIKLTDIERQELILLLFETVANVADSAEEQIIDCSTIYTHNSLTLPIRTNDMAIISSWFYQRITTPEQYFMLITQFYHAYTLTYYTIALLPNFQHRLTSIVCLREVYYASMADEIRKEVCQHYYNSIVKDAKNIDTVQEFFITYAHLIFVKLLYIFTMRSDFEDIEEARAYTRYATTIMQRIKKKHGIRQC